MISLSQRYEAFRRSTPARTIDLDQVRWRWYEAGAGTPALVVLPGAVGGGDVFFLLVQELAATTRVLAVDLPFVPTATQAIAGLDRFLESQEIESAVLLGASFSGLLVQAYARRHPHRVAGLILSHTGALDPSRADRTRRYADRTARIPLAVLRAMLRLLVRAMTRRLGDERRFWRDVYDRAVRDLAREDAVSRYRLAADLEATDATAPFDRPVLVIHSDNDAIAKPAETARLRTAYPQATFREFRGAGHSSYSTDPIAYAAAVGAFIAIIRR